MAVLPRPAPTRRYRGPRALPPPDGHGLIAWLPDCGRNCQIKITNVVSRASVTVRSPLRHDFLGQGGDVTISPDGSELEGFINTGPMGADSAPPFVPALVNTRTGAVRVVRGAVLSNGESSAWTVWLPGGRLLVGPSLNYRYAGYAIDTRTGAAKPFTFFPRRAGYAGASADISYGAVLLPQAGTGRDSRKPQR